MAIGQWSNELRDYRGKYDELKDEKVTYFFTEFNSLVYKFKIWESIIENEIDKESEDEMKVSDEKNMKIKKCITCTGNCKNCWLYFKGVLKLYKAFTFNTGTGTL